MLEELEKEEHEVCRECRGDDSTGSARGVLGVVPATVAEAAAVPVKVAAGTGGFGLWVLPSAKSHSAAKYSGRGSSGIVS